MTVDDKTLPPEALLARITQFVTESRELVRTGAVLEIDGLESRIDELCSMVLSFSQEERLHYADKLQYLLTDISKLGEEMMVLRDAMGDEIRALSSTKKATMAYKIADSRDDFGKRDSDEDQ